MSRTKKKTKKLFSVAPTRLSDQEQPEVHTIDAGDVFAINAKCQTN